ncbi:MAG TPA: hypothetical protein VIK75_10125 [Calditerricola sp.]
MGWLISVAGRILPYWRWLAAGVVLIAVAAGGIWVRGLIAERDELRTRAAALEADLHMRDRLIILQRQAMAAADADRARAEKADRQLQANREEVIRAPETDDGPVAPVLARALERLRQQAGAGDTP